MVQVNKIDTDFPEPLFPEMRVSGPVSSKLWYECGEKFLKPLMLMASIKDIIIIIDFQQQLKMRKSCLYYHKTQINDRWQAMFNKINLCKFLIVMMHSSPFYLIFNSTELPLHMGAMCQTKQQRLEQYNRRQQIQEQARRRKDQLQNGVYSQKVKMYTKYFGRIVDEQTKKFIRQNYNQNYSSEVRTAGYPRYGQLILTYKDRLIDRFQTAFKNRNSTRSLQIVKQDYNSITFVFQTSQTTYDVVAYFDDQDRFKSMIFNERQKYVPVTYHAPEPKPQTQMYNRPQSNNYYGPQKDWGAHYAAETARSNQQFIENMNRQAQEWNNYQTQKANRGW